MPINSTSSQSGFRVEMLPALQLSDGPNPTATPIASPLLIFLPAPDANAAEFTTLGNGGGGVWRVSVSEAQNGVLGAAILSLTVPNSHMMLWVALDPAVYFTDRVYRVQIRDDSNAICDEWDFRCYDVNTSPGSLTGLEEINDAIRRIAGLLGYRQRVTYSDYIQGIPQTTLIELLDEFDAAMASYRRKLVLNDANQVLSETCAALDTNNLGD